MDAKFSIALGVMILALGLMWPVQARPPQPANLEPVKPDATFTIRQHDWGLSAESPSLTPLEIYHVLRSVRDQQLPVASARSGLESSLSDFEDEVVGLDGAIALEAPRDAVTSLTGDLEVLEATPDWPEIFGSKGVAVDGTATVFVRPPTPPWATTGMGFAAGKETDEPAQARLQCWIIEAGEILPNASLTLRPSEPMPTFSNFAILIYVGQYGWCDFVSDPGIVIDRWLIVAEQ